MAKGIIISFEGFCFLLIIFIAFLEILFFWITKKIDERRYRKKYGKENTNNRQERRVTEIEGREHDAPKTEFNLPRVAPTAERQLFQTATPNTIGKNRKQFRGIFKKLREHRRNKK